MKCPMGRFTQLAIVLILATTWACSPGGSSAQREAPPSEGASPQQATLAEFVPYGNEPWPGVLTGGQPSAEDFEQLSQRGLRTVINLRVPTERGTRDEPRWMEELGLTYISIPVEGAAGLSEDVARRLDQALETAERPVLVHCGSSNRVGAAFALRAFHLEGANANEALAIGAAAGMTRLESTVREMLAE